MQTPLKTILVTGKSGFIGKNLLDLLDKSKYKLIGVGRNDLNLLNWKEVNNFLRQNSIDIVIHTAIQGGSRLKPDTAEDFYNNLLMFNNLASNQSQYKMLISFGSGAEKSYLTPKSELEEYITSIDAPPSSYYGFAKYIISNRIHHSQKLFNFRLYGCHYHNELMTRHIRANIIRNLYGDPMIIHKNKVMDYFYLPDLIKVIDYYISQTELLEFLPGEIDLCYKHKHTLLDLCNYINQISKKQTEIIIENPNSLDLPYIGDSYRLEELNLDLTGILQGIQESYVRENQRIIFNNLH